MSRMMVLVVALSVLLLGVVGFGQAAASQTQTGTTPAASTTPEDSSATSTTTGSGSIWPMIIILVIFVAVFYFMLIRPQRKRQAQHNLLLKDLKRGDAVITAGGVYGEIDSVGDTTVVVTVEDGGKLKVAKSSIVDKRAK